MRQTDGNIRLGIADLKRLATILLLLAWTVLTVGCSGGAGDDPDTPQPTPVQPGEPDTDLPILFSAHEQEESNVTRAETPLETKVHSFVVYGFKSNSNDESQIVFPGYIVNWLENSANSSTTNTDCWEYVNQQPVGKEEQTIKYWDLKAKAYRFFGVAGVTGSNKVTGEPVGTDSYKLTFGVNAYKESDTPYYSHLWYSDDPENSYGQAVKLEFIKPLSMVRIIFVFEDPEDAPITELSGVKFRPSDGGTIKMKGDVTVTYPLKSSAGNKESFAVYDDAEGMTEFTRDYYESVTKDQGVGVVVYPYYNADETKTNVEYTVLPVTDQGAYRLTVNVNADPRNADVPAEYMNWLPGYRYIYIFKVHVDGSVSIDAVQSAFTEWENYNTDHTVYNW